MSMMSVKEWALKWVEGSILSYVRGVKKRDDLRNNLG